MNRNGSVYSTGIGSEGIGRVYIWGRVWLCLYRKIVCDVGVGCGCEEW